MKKLMILRGVGIICALLAYWPVYNWLEGSRRGAYQDWLMMDNPMWYNRPSDFGPIGSALGAGFIVLVLVGLTWGFTMPKKDETN